MINQTCRKKGQLVMKAENGFGQVWISGYHFAQNVPQLQENGIGAVCSAVDTNFVYPPKIVHTRICLADDDKQSVINHFPAVFAFVEKHRKNTNVLIHCAAGISRSATLLLSYMMKKQNRKLSECLKIVKSARSICNPNSNFTKQLKMYEKQVVSKKQEKTL